MLIILFLLVGQSIPYFAGREQELPFKQTKMKSKYLSSHEQRREFVPVLPRGSLWPQMPKSY